MAIRCRTALVEPPNAMTTAMAFSNASLVTMSRAVMPRRSRLDHGLAGAAGEAVAATVGGGRGRRAGQRHPDRLRHRGHRVGGVHASGEPRVHLRNEDEGVVLIGAGEGPLVLRLELVVELLEYALAQLGRHGLGVEARGERSGEPQEDAYVGDVRLEGVRDAGVLDLDGDLRPVAQGRPVDLPDGGVALAKASSSIEAKTLSGRSSYSSSSTVRTFSQGIAGA